MSEEKTCPMFITVIQSRQYTETGCGYSVAHVNATGWKFCPLCGGKARMITDEELAERRRLSVKNGWRETIEKGEEVKYNPKDFV